MAPLAILVELQLVRSRALVLVRVIVPALAVFALKRHKGSITTCHRCSSPNGFVSPRPGLNWRPRPYQGRALPTELRGQKMRGSGRRGSNPRRLAWKARALPTELHPHQTFFCNYSGDPLSRVNRLWRGKDSNLRSMNAADLQSAPFGHSGTPPRVTFALLLSVKEPWKLAAGIEPAAC